MLIFFIAISLSTLSTWLIVRTSHLHGYITSDYNLGGVQKFHLIPVPRIGGISLIIGLTGAFGFYYLQNQITGKTLLLLLLSAMPAFFMGFIEDLTKKVGVKSRLFATATSAFIAGHFLESWIFSVQIFGIDNLMEIYPWVAIIFTCFAVAGVANAFNIIDGYNGLSSVVCIIILLGLSYVAFQMEDFEIMIAALSMIFAITGFLFFNYPRGLIFLGDGGAYLIGFWVAELSILLTARHIEVSKWFPLLLCFYPIFETIFTIYRRMILKKSNPAKPDASHLHQLIYKRLIRSSSLNNDVKSVQRRNSLTSPYLWMLTLLTVITAIIFWHNHILLKFFTVVYAILYVYLYTTIVNFNIPNWLHIKNKL